MCSSGLKFGYEEYRRLPLSKRKKFKIIADKMAEVQQEKLGVFANLTTLLR